MFINLEGFRQLKVDVSALTRLRKVTGRKQSDATAYLPRAWRNCVLADSTSRGGC
jgi:hypothetical protein